MRRLVVFNQVSLDGYFVDLNGDMTWAKEGNDEEFNAFTSENAEGGGELLFGRITYELMASFWPTPQAREVLPLVAEQMNSLPKVVFSRTMREASWNNTRLVKGDPVAEIRRMKSEPGEGMVIMGSGSIVSQLAPTGLIDEYQMVLIPVALGGGRTMFEGITERLRLKLVKSRVFRNGKVFLCYEPTA
ncbi:MAG: dihydrofolate reductase family protein [Phycisphaerales bacterium]|jgi:dihydrofolate reductase